MCRTRSTLLPNCGHAKAPRQNRSISVRFSGIGRIQLAIHRKTISERIDWLFDLADRHSEAFSGAEAWLARRRYLVEHPTAIAALKCMDGRVNLSVATHTPPGIIQPFRNLGGMFDLGWPHLGEVLAHYVQRMVGQGRRVVMLITYHYSKGDPQRGCAGFDYDTGAATTHTYAIKRQIEHIFGSGHGTVFPLVCGFETDDDALILHGDNGEKLDLSTLSPGDGPSLAPRLAALFPDMPEQIREDLLPLLEGNLARIAQVRQTSRALDIEHREWMICLGRGFDFLHTPNVALIIGPYSPNLADPIHKAAAIISANMKAGRIPDDGFLLLASVPYDEIGVDRARAELKSRFLSAFAADVIRRDFPELADKMFMRTAVLDWRSRSLQTIDGN
ncbi:MAG: carboxysome shell carbonic anhydrase [Sulfuritalea sp.]|nr:carboxysome shell carbonic anhydrase [Sulfuritalea sp.]